MKKYKIKWTGFTDDNLVFGNTYEVEVTSSLPFPAMYTASVASVVINGEAKPLLLTDDNYEVLVEL